MEIKSFSLPAGKIFGATLRIHLTFFFLLAFIWMKEWEVYGNAAMGRGLAMVGMLFLSVALHELAHCLAALEAGRPPRFVLLLPLGGMSFAEEPGTGYRSDPLSRELRMALAGPLANLLLGAAAVIVLRATAPEIALQGRPWITLANLPRSFIWMNLMLAAINLLPAAPLDGGRILRALLARKMDPVQATRRAVTLGHAFAMLFILAGFWNYWLLFVGITLFAAAQLEERTVLFQSVMESVRMEEVMLTGFTTLSPADTLEDALAKSIHTLQDDFPVVRGADMVGVVSRQKILEALRFDGNAYVQSIMNKAYEVAQRNESLASAFRKLSTRGLSIIPVVDQEKLVGIVTLQNLMHSMTVLAESRKLQRESEEEEGDF